MNLDEARLLIGADPTDPDWVEAHADGLVATLLPGLMASEDPALAGQIGAPYLSRYRLRFDFPGGKLLLARSNEKGPRTAPRP